MTTSARALSRVLAVASKHSNPKDKFLKVVANRLMLEGENIEIETAFWIRNLILRIHNDIESLSFEDTRKARLRSFMSPFNGLENLSHSHFDIGNAKNNFLKPDHLTGLMNIDDALSGNVDYQEFDKDKMGLAKSFRDLRKQLEEVELPPRLKQDFSDMLSRMASMIENLNFYGPEDVQRELEKIVGVIVTNSKSASGNAIDLYRNICALVVPAFLALQGVDQSLGAAISISENTSELLQLFSDESQ